jgi:hypothetical protein
MVGRLNHHADILLSASPEGGDSRLASRDPGFRRQFRGVVDSGVLRVEWDCNFRARDLPPQRQDHFL